MNSMYLDKVSEAIANFIGLFELAGEEVRLRQGYEEFRATHKADERIPDHPSRVTKVVHKLQDCDPGAATKTYVGGECYFDEVLLLANLVPSTPDLGAQNPDMLVTEAAAFLADETDTDAGASHQDHLAPQTADSGSADVMQHMLG